MELINSNHYSSLVGTVVLLISMICLLTSYFHTDKRHTTKLFSILIIASLSLFSSHWATYFAAIFIVATAVTELDFLQTLAAIIRKDKNYFDYKKESLSKSEKIKRKAEETIEEELLVTSRPSGKSPIKLSSIAELSRNDSTRLAMDVEEKALDYLEKEHGKIERNVRLRKDGRIAEFDGLVSSKNSSTNKVFEVKWVKSPEHFQMLMRYAVGGAEKQLEKYREVTGELPDLYLVVITTPLVSIQNERVDKFYKRAKEMGFNLSILTLNDIGIETIE